ncbi:MAG: tetratricopeptide repeat protein, partial [Myxococcota bacterium]
MSFPDFRRAPRPGTIGPMPAGTLVIMRLLRSSLLLLLLAGCMRPATEPADGRLIEQTSADELFARGEGSARAGDFLRAEQYYAAAYDRGYPGAQAVPALLRVCVAADRISAAVGYVEPYVEAHPEEWALRMVLATLYEALGNGDAALATLEGVVVDAPERPEPRYLLGVMYSDVGARPEAIASFERYLALAPTGDHARDRKS